MNVLLLFLAVLGALWLVLALISERHERRRAEAKNCAIELAALTQRAPVVRRMVLPADPCLAVRMVSRD